MSPSASRYANGGDLIAMDCRTCFGDAALHPDINCPGCKGTGKAVTWSTPCRCGHSSVRHVNTDKWNNAGACRWCTCDAFALPAVIASRDGGDQ